MNTEGAQHPQPANGTGRTTQRRAKPKLQAMTALLVIGSVALPYMFWKGTWFGTQLSDDQIRQYLADTENPRKAQHGLAQFAERAEKGESNLVGLYPLVAELAGHEREEIRMTAAWAMGTVPLPSDTSPNASQDLSQLHRALIRLLDDPVPLVRRNAALAISRYGDDACRDVLTAMLRPFDVRSPMAGTVSRLTPVGRPVKAHTHIFELVTADHRRRDIPAPLGGSVLDVHVTQGAVVAEGDVICTLAPGEDMIWGALRALVLVGRHDDLAVIDEVMSGPWPCSERVRKQADLTRKTLQRRRDRTSSHS